MNKISLSLHFNLKSLLVQGTLQTTCHSCNEFDIVSLLWSNFKQCTCIYKDTAPESDNVKASGELDYLCHTKQECQILIKLN